MKRYWDRIETPFGLFAAWVDDAGRLLRFRFRSDDAERLDREAEQNADALKDVRRQVGEYSAGKRKVFEFELLPDGQGFDLQVWKALSDIPFGRTVSYGAIAKAIGQPGAARAVGAANNANPIALIVPCHRVIGSDGSLVGFGGGLALKRRLLEHEARVCGTRYDLFG
jgi:methylated-DNA-[protein]-cysteine S-methyltransferase